MVYPDNNVSHPNWSTPVTRRSIGLTGKLKSGKTEAALTLCKRGFTRVRFAGPLKSMMRCLQLTDAEIEGALKERPCDLLCGKTPRHAMQTIGTDWGRLMIGEDLWVNAWKRLVLNHNEEQPIVCDDVRFDNEVAAVRELGGIIVQIERPMAERIYVSNHASEQLECVPDLTVHNDGSLEEYRAKITLLADERIHETIQTDAA